MPNGSCPAPVAAHTEPDDLDADTWKTDATIHRAESAI
jgi:hypothetical protein